MMTTNITTVINYLKLQTTCAKKSNTKYIAKHHPTTFFHVLSNARQRKNLGLQWVGVSAVGVVTNMK